MMQIGCSHPKHRRSGGLKWEVLRRHETSIRTDARPNMPRSDLSRFMTIAVAVPLTTVPQRLLSTRQRRQS